MGLPRVSGQVKRSFKAGGVGACFLLIWKTRKDCQCLRNVGVLQNHRGDGLETVFLKIMVLRGSRREP